MTLSEKLTRLQTILQDMGTLAVAFSGGVDSTFLLAAAKKAVGENVIAITALSETFPQREQQEALDFCKDLGVRHCVIHTRELEIPGFAQNPPDRCYICKKALFTGFLEKAAREGCAYLCEGSNMDDLGDYRPGLRAIRELGIRSPLREAELTKAEIRELSRQWALPTWDKPSYACLASRFVYGETITQEKLSMVDRGEQLLQDLGFRQMRLRVHGNLARIEVLPRDMDRFSDPVLRKTISDAFRSLGFAYVTLDLAGYRTGSMNETL